MKTIHVTAEEDLQKVLDSAPADRVTIRDLTVANDAGDPRTKGLAPFLMYYTERLQLEN